MRYLLDTSILLWALADHPALSPAMRNVLKNPEHVCYVSMASLWEIAIKAAIGKLDMKKEFFDEVESYGYATLPLTLDHINAFRHLPVLHRDPFDRMLVTQAICEQLTLLTHDRELIRYDVKIILA